MAWVQNLLDCQTIHTPAIAVQFFFMFCFVSLCAGILFVCSFVCLLNSIFFFFFFAQDLLYWIHIWKWMADVVQTAYRAYVCKTRSRMRFITYHFQRLHEPINSMHHIKYYICIYYYQQQQQQPYCSIDWLRTANNRNKYMRSCNFEIMRFLVLSRSRAYSSNISFSFSFSLKFS